VHPCRITTETIRKRPGGFPDHARKIPRICRAPPETTPITSLRIIRRASEDRALSATPRTTVGWNATFRAPPQRFPILSDFSRHFSLYHMTHQGARHLRIDPEYAGQRIDNYLIRELAALPRTRIYRMIRSGEVRLDGRRVHAEQRLLGGEDLRIPPMRVPADAPDSRGSRIHCTSAAPRMATLHDDERLLVVDKPAGLAVHGGSGVQRGLIEWLRHLRPELRYLELAHRLDRETSGVLVLAKRRSALLAVQAALRERRVGKRYLAVVAGEVPAREFSVRVPLLRELGAMGERVVRVDPEGREALSKVRGLGNRVDPELALHYSVVEVRIETGRTHQIRVHLQHLGLPILGDERYGDFQLNRRLHAAGVRRMLLHAAEIALPWPTAPDERLTLRAPLPDAFARWGFA